MNGNMKSYTVGEFLIELEEMEDEIRVNLMQCGLRLKSTLDGDRKNLIIEPDKDIVPYKIAEIVCGKMLDVRLEFEAARIGEINDEAQITHMGLTIMRDTAIMLRKLFWSTFERRYKEPGLIDRIKEVDQVSGKLYEIYAHKKDSDAAETPEEQAEVFNMAAAKLDDLEGLLPPKVMGMIKESAKKIAAELEQKKTAAQVMEEAAKRAGGVVVVTGTMSETTN